MSRSVTFLQGAYEAQFEEMTKDDSVILMGQDLESNLYGAANSFRDHFGAARVRDVPISEAATVGMAAGAAMTGLRPVLDLTMSNFIYNAMDQLVNQVAKSRYMFGGQARIPVVYRTILLYQGGNAAHHSDRPYSMFMNVPGLKIIVPSTGADLKGLLKSAIRDDNPVLCFEDANLWSTKGKGELPDDDDYLIPIGKGCVRRSGTDVTIVGIANGVTTALAAAAELAEEGIDAEVIDPRTLVPLDWPLIAESISRTGRLVVVDPANRTCGAASEISALAAEHCFGDLRAPVRRVTTPDVHVPYAQSMENVLYPTSQKVQIAVRELVR